MERPSPDNDFHRCEIAHWLARLCTNRFVDLKPPADMVCDMPMEGRHLPQGAPTSPAIANLCAWALDVRLTGLARKFESTYMRYADDLTFSSSGALAHRGRIAFVASINPEKSECLKRLYERINWT